MEQQQQLSTYERHKAAIKAWYEKNKDDPDFKRKRAEKQAEYRRRKYATDPEYKEKQRQEARKRYHAVCKNDEEFMKRNRERALESYYKRKAAGLLPGQTDADVDDATIERVLGVDGGFFLDGITAV